MWPDSRRGLPPEGSQRSIVLIVCTGNLCRSPILTELLRAEFAAIRQSVGAIEVVNAGTHARAGEPVPVDIRELALRAHLDVAAHTARPLDAGLIESADLILGAAREHRSTVIRARPRASRTTFTVGEFVRLTESLVEGASLGSRDSISPPPTVAELVAMAGARRGYIEPTDDDIVDPMGQTRSVQATSLDQMVSLSSRLGRALSELLHPARW
jgi:protein-tyrosine phosphatase